MKRLLWILIWGVALDLLLLVTPVQAAGETLPLAEIGPYNEVGRQSFSLVDESRDRELTGYIWYPSASSANRRPGPLVPKNDLPLAEAAAPYPLVIYSHPKTGDGVDANFTLGLGPHLASYGFVVISVNHNDPANRFLGLVHRPMDILFTLNQFASSENAWSGLINFEKVGIAGYSLGGTSAMQLTGASIDPLALSEFCASSDNAGWATCDISEEIWQAVLDERAKFDPPVIEGEIWPPYTDSRIAAVMPIAPCMGPFFGERGLAGADVPTLIVGQERDERCMYELHALFMYEHMGSDNRALLNLLKQRHLGVYDDRDVKKILSQYAVAFFGYHIQGKTEYADYLTGAYAAEFNNLTWESTIE